MELYSDCDKQKRMRSSWYNFIVLVGLLLALNLAAFFTEISQETVRRSVNEGPITLGVKFLNFCIAKSTQFRYVDPLQAQPSVTKLVFWFTLARSVSSVFLIERRHLLSQEQVQFKFQMHLQKQESRNISEIFSTFKNRRKLFSRCNNFQNVTEIA